MKNEETTKGFKERYIWSRDIPIITKDKITDVFLTTHIQEPEVYNEFYYKLANAKEDETYYLNLNTPGGVIDSAFMIADAAKRSKAKIVGRLSGTVASAGTIVALECDEIEVADYTAWLSHNYSTGISGKGHELKAFQKFTDDNLNSSFKKMHAGFFTDKEVEDIIEGKDIWLNKEEIITRWNNRKIHLATS